MTLDNFIFFYMANAIIYLIYFHVILYIESKEKEPGYKLNIKEYLLYSILSFVFWPVMFIVHFGLSLEKRYGGEIYLTAMSGTNKKAYVASSDLDFIKKMKEDNNIIYKTVINNNDIV